MMSLYLSCYEHFLERMLHALEGRRNNFETKTKFDFRECKLYDTVYDIIYSVTEESKLLDVINI